MNYVITKWAIAALTLMIAIVMLSVVVSATPWQKSPSQPKITWSVNEISETLFPGTSKTVTVKFRSDQNIEAVVVRMTPSLDDVVSANPTNFSSIMKNHDYELRITLAPPGITQKKNFGGTIQLRDADKSPRTFAEPLQVGIKTDFSTYVNTRDGYTVPYPLGYEVVD